MSNEQGEDLEDVVFLLFMFFGLGMGVIVTQLHPFVGDAIPYTVLIFLVGLVLSPTVDSNGKITNGLLKFTHNLQTDTFGDSISNWANINVELLLYVFLPPLVFGEAMALNWHHLKVAAIPSLLLAGPGVLFGATLMGLLTKLIFPHWGWNLVMTFGSILSATDTVAVVALLKSVGASPKLTMLVVGESLLNDGTTLVLFEIFFQALNGKVYTAGEIIAYAIASFLGSMMFGIASGLLCVKWLRSASRPLKETDVTMQIAMTITCAYLTFFTAQYIFRMSGIIACCGAGGMLAYLGPPIILNHESMHNVWGMAEWALNTMIFLLAGVIIGNEVLRNVPAIDWLILLVLYGLLMGVRALTIALFYPALSTIGHGCSRYEAVFMSWAGLRGALGVALALIVKRKGPDDLSNQLDEVLFFVSGVAALTLILNATTAKSLLLALGLLSTDTAEKRLVTKHIKVKLQHKLDFVLSEMSKQFSFTDKDLVEVRASCTLLKELNRNYFHYQTDQLPLPSTDESRLKPASIEGYSTTESRQGIPRVVSHHQLSRALTTVGLAPSRLVLETIDSRIERMRELVRARSRLHENTTTINPSLLNYDLLIYIRSIFLEIVRVKYWHFIEIGKLPRLSFSAQYLFYSIDVGLDQVHRLDHQEIDHDIYSKDWVCIEREISRSLPSIHFLQFWERRVLPFGWREKFVSPLLQFIEHRREKRLVYLLTAFIEAHEHAQTKIHRFLRAEDDIDEDLNGDNDSQEPTLKRTNRYSMGSTTSSDHDSEEDMTSSKRSITADLFGNDNHSSQRSKSHAPSIPKESGILDILSESPEELLVLQESKLAIERAKQLLSEMDKETVVLIRVKQATRMILAKEAEIIKNLVADGFLTSSYANKYLEEISENTRRIERRDFIRS